MIIIWNSLLLIFLISILFTSLFFFFWGLSYSFIWNISLCLPILLILCVYFYILGKSLISSDLGERVLCSKHPMGSRSTLSLWFPELYVLWMSPVWAACTLLLWQGWVFWVFWWVGLFLIFFTTRPASYCGCGPAGGQIRLVGCVAWWQMTALETQVGKTVSLCVWLCNPVAHSCLQPACGQGLCLQELATQTRPCSCCWLTDE